LIFGTYCNHTMQLRIEEHKDFESTIKNDPIALLKTIRILMHDPQQAKYPYVSVTKVIVRVLISTKQREDESLIDYVTRFKSARNVMKSHVGAHFLDNFVEHSEEYRTASPTQQQTLKDKAFERWMAFLLLRNSDEKVWECAEWSVKSIFIEK